MRLGIFGGSFDPPHLGHLLPVIDAAETLALDVVRFVPAAHQPFKVGRARATSADRFAMTQRLVAGIPGLAADAVETDRGGLSYTVDTLAQIAASVPEAELVLLVGADAYALFDAWRDPARILELASVAVLARSGLVGEGEARRGEEEREGEGEGDGEGKGQDVLGRAGVRILRTRRVDISSTELRARVAAGRSIRGFTPDAVADYVAEHRLYR